MKSLLELAIGQVSKQLKIVLNLDKTTHAGERQYRTDQEGDYVSDKEILKIANNALSHIVSALIFNKIDIGDYILIRDNSSNLNLIGFLRSNNKKLELVIITVMRKKNFKAKAGTKIINI